ANAWAQSIGRPPPPGTRSGGGTSVQLAVHPVVGNGFGTPASHCSAQSMTPLPHASRWQVGEQPSQPCVLPSSQPSPRPTTPSPHTAVLGKQSSFSGLLVIVLPATSSAPRLKRRRSFLAPCGTRRDSGGVQWSVWG